MWWKNWKRPLASSVLALGLTALAGACSSGTAVGGATDAGGTHPPEHKDGGPDAGKDASSTTGNDASTSSATFDGTTGLPCASNADCKGAFAGSPGQNQCSNAMYFMNNNPIDPTAICLSPVLCDLGADPNFLQYCDSADPTDPTSPGLCLPSRLGNTGINGQCYPKCTILPDGSAPIGCQGTDTCGVQAVGVDQTGAPLALGVCIGGCAQDADCPTGSVCQKDEGVCKLPAFVQTATKQLGAACSANDNVAPRYACFCLMNPTTMLGYCSPFCIVGSTTASCPTGYVCDAGLPTTITLQSGTVAGFTTQNAGLQGRCVQACSFPDGGGTDAAQGLCGPTATCQPDTSGNVCFP